MRTHKEETKHSYNTVVIFERVGKNTFTITINNASHKEYKLKVGDSVQFTMNSVVNRELDVKL